MHAKRLSKKLRHPEERQYFRFFFDEENLHQDEKVSPRNDSANADAHIETLQTTVVKPPWIDSVANGGKSSYFFQQDSAPSYKALETQDWMAVTHQTYGHLTHQTLILRIIKDEGWLKRKLISIYTTQIPLSDGSNSSSNGGHQ
ncbi:hypothetical protein ACTXT7_010305 [Hymenolepis weldensis]